MSLLQNNTLYSQYPYTSVGSHQGSTDMVQFSAPGRRMGRFGVFSPLCSIPIGYRNALAPALTNGGLGVSIGGAGSFVANGVYGRGIGATIPGSGRLVSGINALGHMEAELEGSGEISTADISGAVFLVALLTGNGSLAADISAAGELSATLSGASTVSGVVNGVIEMLANLSGSGGITEAALSAGKYIEAALSGDGSIDADISAIGHLEAVINIGFQPSALDIAQALLNAIAAEYNVPGTIGNKINSAGSAADPWGTELPGTYAEGTAGNILIVIENFVDIIKKIQTGRWKIFDNKMVFYDIDGETPLYSYELKDENGNLTMRNPVERNPL